MNKPLTMADIARKHAPKYARLPEPLADQITRIAQDLACTVDITRAQAAFALLKIADEVRELEGEVHARKRQWRGWLARWLT